VEEQLKKADLAMYEAKAAGRNTIRYFDPQMQVIVNNRALLEADLRQALLHNELILYFQPQFIADHTIVGVEALVRWPHAKRGMVSPVEFIPVAENTGLIIQVGNWVLHAACLQLVKWAAIPETATLTISVNVSAHQFRHPDFVMNVLTTLENTGANPTLLKLELTESILVEDVEATIAKMNALKEHGIGFSLDDFGTGYSSLAYLKRMPLEQLKIDRSFIKDMLVSSNDASIVRIILALGRAIGTVVIAEGVETAEQYQVLRREGCDGFQGYYFSRPIPVSELQEILYKNLILAAS
jgi:EAL domain-containing protein (putative c-di-GMP-specific phosphodiesterase class I)